MEKRTDITNTMVMEMYMQTCCMCMTCCADLSDVLSILEVNPCAA